LMQSVGRWLPWSPVPTEAPSHLGLQPGAET
jgi:hypothetical protein